MELGTVADASADTLLGEPASPARPVCSRPIDLVHLARYTLGNKTLEREILELFVGQSLTTLKMLAVANNDKEWREAAHALLGSAKAVGAGRIVDRVVAAQKHSWAGDPARRPELVAAISSEISIANRYIRELFPEE